MVKQFLITRPRYDKETSYIYSFSKPIIILAREEKNIQTLELEGEKATRRNFEEGVGKTEPKLIFLNGHGDEKSVWGHQDEPILDKGNISLMKGKIIYALACESLAGLGKMAVRKGVEAYIGYFNEFRWTVDPSRTSVPEKDKNAAPFRKVCFVLGQSLLSGMPAGEAVSRTMREYEKLIRSYGQSKDDFGDAPLIGLALSWDLMFLGMEGNPGAAF